MQLDINEVEKTTHPSAGTIEFSRRNCNGMTFWGSELKQDNYVSLTVSTGEMQRSLNKDKFYPNERILELRMTASQFSELITTMNLGSHIPCTLEFVNGQIIESPDLKETHQDFTHRKFRHRMKQFSKSLKEDQDNAINIINKKTLTKEDQYNLKSYIEKLSSEIGNNIPYFLERFQEGTDKIVNEAKLEVENAILHKINTLGLQQLKEENLKIENK